MKVVRSTKCSLGFSTRAKRLELREVLSEYGRVVNVFIGRFWGRRWQKRELTKGNIVVEDTWLSARMRKVAAREAIDMARAARERDGRLARKPVHKGTRMCVSSTIGTLRPSKEAASFDAWLHLASIGRGIRLDLPVRYHRHYLRYAQDPRARRKESYIITEESVQLAFEVEVGEPRTEGPELGLDSGVHALATLSDCRRFGTDLEGLMAIVRRRRHGSRGQQRARHALHQRMAEVAKEIAALEPRTLVVEDLKRLHHGMRRDRRLSRNMRRSLGAWAYRDWLGRLERACEMNRVRFVRVPPAYSSQRCHVCGHTERGNRKGEMFRCRGCGYSDQADVNAARNLLDRFEGGDAHPAGAYGPGFPSPGVE